MSWPQPWLSCSTFSSDNLYVTCCHTYRPQPIEHVQETIAMDQTPQRQVEFPNTNIVHNFLRLPNSSINYWGGQSFWTHPYWPQPAHSHRQHSPTRAQLKGFSCSSVIPSSTRGIPFRAQLEECHVLNLYPELNLRDTFCAQLKEHQQSHLWSTTKSLVDHAFRNPEPKTAASKSLGGGHIPPCATSFQTAWRVMRTAKRLASLK